MAKISIKTISIVTTKPTIRRMNIFWNRCQVKRLNSQNAHGRLHQIREVSCHVTQKRVLVVSIKLRLTNNSLVRLTQQYKRLQIQIHNHTDIFKTITYPPSFTLVAYSFPCLGLGCLDVVCRWQDVVLYSVNHLALHKQLAPLNDNVCLTKQVISILIYRQIHKTDGALRQLPTDYCLANN